MKRFAAFACILGAPLGLALLNTGVPSTSWLLVAAVPIALYGVYALGVSRFFPAPVLQSVPTPTGRVANDSRRDADWLLLVRGLACVLVFIMHSGIAFNRDFTDRHSSSAWILESPAWLGMMLFFTLSGYLMGKGFYTGKYDLSRSSVTRYLRNRFLRIFPLMIVVGLVIAVWNSPALFAMPQVGARVSLFQYNGIGGTGPIAAFWSLSAEWQFYLLVPALFALVVGASRLVTPMPKVLLPLATLLVLGAGTMIRQYQWTHHAGIAGWSQYIFPNMLGNIDVFLLGFLANWWVPRFGRVARALGTIWPLLLLGIYLPYAFISYQALFSPRHDWFYTFAVLLPGLTALALIPVLAGCEARNRRERQRAVPHQRTALALFWVGALTYPVYLVHSSILVDMNIGLPTATLAKKWAIGTVMVVVIAWILHMTVERAVLNWRESRDAQPANTSAAQPAIAVSAVAETQPLAQAQ